MTTQTTNGPVPAPAGQPITIKDLHTENPRWCVGCGDFGVTMGLKRFVVDTQLQLHTTVNISGIGCSGRAPNYYNTYGVHSIHGRPITIALGLAIARPDLNIFVHSGDGDALSIGGNHLIHGINKNFNCVFMLYDNELYALTKNQTSPTTRREHPTMTQPHGTYLEPIDPIRMALGLGASFVAGTADWIPDHLGNTLKAAFEHKGFSFVHILQRCPHFDPFNFDHKSTTWFGFLKNEKGIAPDKRIADKTEVIDHDPGNLVKAFELALQKKRYFGLYYRDANKPCYDDILRNLAQNAPQKPRTGILDAFKI
ncbi:MAG: thiamine pyrophosphate-dependent enzyme [Candidatus Omnitrophota bacterium]|nr:thiamine pyrophosphate-dependent enzyme [Candidatus Omnitrophota bacterium]MDZ4241984.1 thiamine pyrophosphate-dependent enzyme [Candidatus Omnitrophota bacterium]